MSKACTIKSPTRTSVMLPASSSRRCISSAPAACSCTGSVAERGGDVGAGAGLRARTAMAESSAVPSMNQVLGFDDRCEGGEWMEDLEASRNVAMAPPGCGKQGGGKAPNLHTVAQDDAQYTSTAKPGTPSCAPTISRAPRTPSSLTHLSGPKEVEEMI